MKKSILILLLLVSIFAGCVSAPTEKAGPVTTPPSQTLSPGVKGPSDIKMGIVVPLTGAASTTGNDMWATAQLAAEEINAKGGVYISEYGRKIPIKLYAGDDESNPTKGVATVTRLIQQDKVDILVGGFSSAVTYADSKIAADEGMPFVITGASSSIITHRNDTDTTWFFHHCPTTDDYSYYTIKFVNDVIRPAVNKKFGFPDTRKLKVALVYRDDAYGKGVKSGVEKALKENPDWKIQIVAQEPFKPSETDFRTILTTVKNAKPDVVYPATFINEQVPLVTQGRRDVGLNTIYLAVEATDDADYYTGVGEWGVYSIQETRFSPYSVPKGTISTAINKFREDFKAKFNEYPSMMGASTYEGIYVATKAMENAGSLDKAKVKAALTVIEVPQMVEAMEGGVIKFSKDFRESKFKLYMSQLVWDTAAKEPRPKIVWPDDLKEQDFVLPEWYKAGE